MIGYDFGYENRVNLCPLVSSPVRSNSKPPRRHLTRGLRDERCPQWLSVKCLIRPEKGTERLGNRCSIRLSYGATGQQDSALRSAGKSSEHAVHQTASPWPVSSPPMLAWCPARVVAGAGAARGAVTVALARELAGHLWNALQATAPARS
jgi:hypothetical protein